MAGINLSVHPLFFAFGIYYALTGRIFVFAIYTICAIVHELGHSYVASALGYRLNKITLMPFGAVVSGNIRGLKSIDELKIAFAGPMVNVATGLFLVACWWLYPQSYAYTDIAAEANFTMAIINFLPIYPLDGGRALNAMVSHKWGEKKGEVVCKITGAVFSLLLFSLFIISVFHKINISLLFFSLFVLAGTFSREKGNRYVKIYSGLNKDSLKRGMTVKRQAIDKSVTIKKLIGMLDPNALNEVEIYDNGKKVCVLSQENIEKIIEEGDIYSETGKYINKTV